MQSRKPSRSSSPPPATPAERPAIAFVAALCGAKKTALAPPSELAMQVQATVGMLQEIPRELIVVRYGIDGEEPPVSDIEALRNHHRIEGFRLSATEVNRHLVAAEERVRTKLRSYYPVLMADPAPTPRTH